MLLGCILQGIAFSQTATTGATTNVTDLTATMSGTVNPGGTGEVNVIFEFGTTTAYEGPGTWTATPFQVTGNSITNVSATASGLLPLTTYHYRTRASYSSNPSIIFYGEDQTFTTAPPATAPQVSIPSGAVSGPAPTAVTLNCQVAAGSSAASLVCDYGPTAGYGNQVASTSILAPSTNTIGSVVLTGLSASTTYHYRFTASNGEGTHSTTSQTFTTPALPTVSTLAADINNATTATLNGSYLANGATYTAAFDLGTTTSYGTTISGSFRFGFGLPWMPRSHSQYANVSPQTEHHYRLKLTDNYGNVYTGSDASFTTPTPIGHWRSQTFGSASDTGDAADMANPIGDGIPNLMKYALNLNPLQTCALPAPELITHDGQRHLRFTFNRYHTRIDLIYEVQVADNPAGPWSTIATSANGAVTSGPGVVSELLIAVALTGSSGSGWSQVEVRDPIGTGSSANRFMRLLVRRL